MEHIYFLIVKKQNIYKFKTYMMQNIQKRQQEFVKSLEGKTLAELEAIEQEIIAEADAHDKKISTLMLQLPTEGYEAAAKGIRKLLNKQKIKWQATLAFKNMYERFDPANNPKEIPFPTYDALVKTLGALEYEGYEEWCAVIDVNEFFKPLRDEYYSNSEEIYVIAEKHHAVMEKMEQIRALTEPVKK